MIRAIIFDCFGVLTADKWKEFTASLPPEQAVQAGKLNHAYDAGMISLQEFLQQVNDVTGKKPDLVEELLDNEITKNTHLLEYIATLKPRFQIGLLSNIATNWIRDIFLTPEEQKLFDDMVLSYEVHMTKPDPRIFLFACERLGVEPHEAVLVDDIDRYCTAARSLGMYTIVYHNFPLFEQELNQILADTNK